MIPARRDAVPPARPPRGRARRPLALAAALLVPCALAGCRTGGSRVASAAARDIADTKHVAPEEETFFADLPGVAGFDGLSVEQQAAVAARANRAKCDCGCFGHSISACLHQREECEIAVRLAERFVADARLGEALAAGAEPDGAEGASAPPPAGPDDATADFPADASGPPAADASGAVGAGAPVTGSGAAGPAAPQQPASTGASGATGPAAQASPAGDTP